MCYRWQQKGVIARVTELARNVEISFQSRTGTRFSVRSKKNVLKRERELITSVADECLNTEHAYFMLVLYFVQVFKSEIQEYKNVYNPFSCVLVVSWMQQLQKH